MQSAVRAAAACRIPSKLTRVRALLALHEMAPGSDWGGATAVGRRAAGRPAAVRARHKRQQHQTGQHSPPGHGLDVSGPVLPHCAGSRVKVVGRSCCSGGSPWGRCWSGCWQEACEAQGEAGSSSGRVRHTSCPLLPACERRLGCWFGSTQSVARRLGVDCEARASSGDRSSLHVKEERTCPPVRGSGRRTPAFKCLICDTGKLDCTTFAATKPLQ
jgi:hypothetical protein